GRRRAAAWRWRVADSACQWCAATNRAGVRCRPQRGAPARNLPCGHRREQCSRVGSSTVRIAYICADPGVPVFRPKGCWVRVQEFMGRLRRNGAAVELFARRLDGEPPDTWSAVGIHKLSTLAGADVAAREQAALAANPALRAALERAGPFDLVY